jgi:murein DD-endopeptidase MepM/ murein hydrolase activator NlpD
MRERKSAARRVGDFLAGKGFYIVLFVCTAVIGVSAWVLLFSDGTGDRADVASYTDTSATTGGAVKSPDATDVTHPPSSAEKPAFSLSTPKPSPTPNPAPTQKPMPAPKPTPSPTPSPAPTPKPTPNAGDNHENTGTAKTVKDLTFIWPVAGDVGMDYAMDALIYSKTMADWRTHDGIDIGGALGTKVAAVSDGTVESVYDDDMLGTTLVIDHGFGLKSVYSNLAAEPNVKVGDKVALGAVVGSIGDTALGESGETTHLHLAMSRDGASVSPADYLPKK